MDGGNITPSAGNATASANSLSALSLSIARYTRASEKLYRKGAFLAENAARMRRRDGRQCLCITGGNPLKTRGKGIKKQP